MRVVKNIINQTKVDRNREHERERREAEHRERHSGESADRRVSLIKNILNKAEPTED